MAICDYQRDMIEAVGDKCKYGSGMMNAPFKTLANPLMREVGPATPRVPEPFIDLDLPEDTLIVSADGHWELDGDVFIDAFNRRPV